MLLSVVTTCTHLFYQNTEELLLLKQPWQTERKTGVTLMRMVRKMDAGPIVGQEVVPIGKGDTGTTLRNKLAESCVPLMRIYMENLLTEMHQKLHK